MTAAILALLLAAQIPGPNEALGWAIAHSVEQPEAARPFYRYVWIDHVPQRTGRDWDQRHVAAAMSYAINEAASQVGVIIQPRVIAGGHMLAVYLPNYATTRPSPDGSGRSQIQALISTWDGIAKDEPYFHIPKEISGIRAAVLAAGVDSQYAGLLAGLNASPSLVYRAGWFTGRILDKDYYRFAQFGATQQSVYSAIGIDEKLVQSLVADRRIALFRSEVASHKPRRVDRLRGPFGDVFQTWDIFDESIREQNHPLYNLARFNPDGGEAIASKPNGLHAYILYDATRNLQAKAPPNLVADHTIPAPHTRELRPAISCIRCHGASGGWQSANNDVQTLLASGLDITDDLTEPDQQTAVLDLAARYQGQFDMGRPREDYSIAVRRATSMPHQPEGMSVAETAELIAAIYHDEQYEPVTAEIACRKLAIESLNEVPAATPENVVLAALKAGLSVRPADFEQAYSSLYWRAVAARQEKLE